MAGPLTSLLRAIADDPAFVDIAGLKDATIAISEPARAAALAAVPRR